MSSIEERLQRDIAAVTRAVVVSDSDLRDARDSVEDRIDSRQRRNGRRTAMAVAAAVIIPIVGVVALQTLGGDDKTAEVVVQPETFTSPPPNSIEAVPIEPGTYPMPIDGWSVTDYTITVPKGWSVQYGHDFIKHPDSPTGVGFKGIVIDEIYDDACHEGAVPVKVGPGTEALVAALQEQLGPKVSPPVQTTLGDHPATRIDLRAPDDIPPDCRMGGRDLQIWYSAPADDYLVFGPGYVASVYILDVDGQRQVFLAGHTTAASAEDLAELQSVIDSVRILS
ncbi:MAG TPA: hypothetical protein VLI04_16225 [Nocardioidaceae bacterium]|nr:hypothetical protein [Nocardioidaceae bacterium]